MRSKVSKIASLLDNHDDMQKKLDYVTYQVQEKADNREYKVKKPEDYERIDRLICGESNDKPYEN